MHVISCFSSCLIPTILHGPCSAQALSLVTCGAITSPSPQIVDLLEGGASEMQKTLEVKVTKTLQALQATFEAGDGVQHSLLGGLVQDNLALLDEPLVAVGGCPMLPLLLPEQHMQSEKGRKMQTHLAALLDCVCLPGMVHLMSRIAECMATGCPHVGSVSLPAEDNLKHDLAVALDVSVYNGVQSPADFTAIQNLLWLLQSLPSSSSTEAKELMQFIPNALHELFYTWHKVRHLAPRLLLGLHSANTVGFRSNRSVK